MTAARIPYRPLCGGGCGKRLNLSPGGDWWDFHDGEYWCLSCSPDHEDVPEPLEEDSDG